MTPKRMIIQALLALLFLIAVFISAYVAKSIPTQEHRKDDVQVEESISFEDLEEARETDGESGGENILDVLNQLATMSEETGEIHVRSKIYIGVNEHVKPGIYDVEFIEGSGNIFGERGGNSSLMTNAWKGDANGKEYPSKIRMILLEGDSISHPGITRVKFKPVPEEVEPANELGVGDFIVGRDIEPGEYKLSTNVALNPQLEDQGWKISIIKIDEASKSEQKFTATTDDIEIELKEGEIISLAYEETDEHLSADEARIIFTEI